MSIVTMPLSIQIEFKSVDEAIVVLGKLTGAPSAPSKGAAGEVAQAPVTAAPATRTRKPRSDAGQTRGKYAPRQQEAGAAQVPETARSGDGTPDGAPAVDPAPAPAGAVPAAPTATRADAQAALEALVSQVNLDAGIKLLLEFGVQRLRDLPDEKLGEFVEKAKAALPKAAA